MRHQATSGCYPLSSN